MCLSRGIIVTARGGALRGDENGKRKASFGDKKKKGCKEKKEKKGGGEFENGVSFASS